MNGDKTLFPLFTKAPATSEPRPSDEGRQEVNVFGGLDGTYDEPQSKKPTKSRKPRKKQEAGQKTLQEIVNPKAEANGVPSGVEEGDRPAETMKEEPSPRRSKRRRTSHTDSIEVGGQEEDASAATPPQRHSSPQVIVPASSPLLAQPIETTADGETTTPPKKMLRLKAGGKFSSPISKKSADEGFPAETKKRGRPRKAKEQAQKTSLMAVIAYGSDSNLGQRIARILAGEERYKKQVKIVPKKQTTPRKANGKSAHPFFDLDRRKEPPPQPVAPSPRKASAVTPGKLRREHPDHVKVASDAQEHWTSSLLKDRQMFRHPGAQEPAWPDKEQLHVRGLSECRTDMDVNGPADALPHRKRKTAHRNIPQSETLLQHVAMQLEAEQDGALRADGFREPHPSLRLPTKSLISGQEAVVRVAKQLSMSLREPGTDELSYDGSPQQSTHSAIQKAYDRITASKTELDDGKGEIHSWTQKYAPSSCEEVLQPVRQAKVLKEWLTLMKVSAVENAPKAESKVSSKTEAKAKKRKRRPKDDDMDDFLVDSDEDVRDMDELTDPDETPAPSQGRKALNSIVQVAVDGAKLSNAVLLSGPHGCGKTAAAYAAARELGYKVFEISSSDRRSGKDVLDKVGNMTENHLVRHHGNEAAEQLSTEESSARLDEAFQRDLASGRQGTMASFFKPQAKAKAKPKAAAPKEAIKAKALKTVQDALRKSPRDQQQSLILLEEVDILFKEDKDFWTTIFKLITTSKRPFIMTCNDEDLVPLQAMSLHAILRFTQPPLDLSTDYLLLVAANEGHLLKRDDVMSLYRAKGSDLRASISELNLWCQMGVGDPRGGLGWIFQRFPPGSDLDAKGRRLHLASEGTYQKGMESTSDQTLGEEGMLIWMQREHGIDAPITLGWDELDLEPVARLKDFSNLAEDLSAADVYARGQWSSHFDNTQKPMVERARGHYIEGLPLLQVDEHPNYHGIDDELMATSTLMAFKTRNVLPSSGLQQRLNAAPDSINRQQYDITLNRHAFACFDAISIPAESALSTVSGLQQSVFDGALEPIAVDIAPYVRSIVNFDLALAEQRDALGGGKGAKRVRTTRAARSALEGGQRGSTRRERWFANDLDFEAVLATGGRDWPKVMAVAGAADAGDGAESDVVPASSAESA